MVDIEHLYTGLQQFRQEMLRELRALREELSELRHELSAVAFMESARESTPAVDAAVEAATADGAVGPSRVPPPNPEALLQRAPAGLVKRLQPLLGCMPSEDGRPRVLWLLEVSENVEDFVRYEGDDWPQAGEFLRALDQVQQAWGLERINPDEGENVDPSLHLVLQSIPGAEKRDQIARCARPGYSYAGEILRRAEVVVYL